MRRRTLLTGITVCFATTAGCINLGAITGTNSNGTNSNNSKPEFEVNKNAPGTFILLRNQPQDPNGIIVGEKFEIGIHLGNAGGESATGEVSIKLTPPNEEGTVQTASTVVDDNGAIPSGEARFFTLGSFEATVAGHWELTAASGIDRVHKTYGKTIEVRDRQDD